MRNRLRWYLSDQGVRLKPGTRLAQDKTLQSKIRPRKPWSPIQWQLIEGMLIELWQAEARRQHWGSLIAQEVLLDPQLLSLTRLCGIRDLVAFALGAFIGDIHRFSNPAKLVNYIGLNPAFDDSGQGQWSGGIGGHGRKDLRSLLMESAQSILRSGKTPLADWGKKLLGRKGVVNLAVAAMARKLAVAVWYLLMGRWTALEEIQKSQAIKVSKMISEVGPQGLKKLGKSRAAFRQEIYQSLMTQAVYVLDPSKKWSPAPVTPRTASGN